MPPTSKLLETKTQATLRWSAALVGTLPGALFAMVCLARFLPFSESMRFTLGFTLGVPLWVTAMCVTLLAASGTRAWLACLGAALVLGVLALAIPH
jgi:hypothetical protein